MSRLFLLSCFFVVSVLSFAAQTKTEPSIKPELIAQILPENFKSDGCTHFPNADYLDCCVQHDLAYFNGGTWKQRWQADGKLRKCVAAKKGWWHKPVSLMMWSGVRIGGAPFLRQPFSWGFGKKISNLSPKSKVEN